MCSRMTTRVPSLVACARSRRRRRRRLLASPSLASSPPCLLRLAAASSPLHLLAFSAYFPAPYTASLRLLASFASPQPPRLFASSPPRLFASSPPRLFRLLASTRLASPFASRLASTSPPRLRLPPRLAASSSPPPPPRHATPRHLRSPPPPRRLASPRRSSPRLAAPCFASSPSPFASPSSPRRHRLAVFISPSLLAFRLASRLVRRLLALPLPSTPRFLASPRRSFAQPRHSHSLTPQPHHRLSIILQQPHHTAPPPAMPSPLHLPPSPRRFLTPLRLPRKFGLATSSPRLASSPPCLDSPPLPRRLLLASPASSPRPPSPHAS